MSIADQITRIRGNISNAYDACNEKGATLPTTQNSANLAATITSIKAGGTGTIDITTNGMHDVSNYASANVNVAPELQEKTATTNGEIIPDDGYYGLSKVTVNVEGGSSDFGVIPREVSSSGKLGFPVDNFTFSLPSGVTDLVSNCLRCSFFNCLSLTSVDLSSLTTISGGYCMQETFFGCQYLTSVNLSNLQTISGESCMYQIFCFCFNLTLVELPNLQTISGSSAMYGVFNSCSKLTSVNFPSLTTISGKSSLERAFGNCSKLTSVDFPSLTTISGSNALYSAFYNCKSLTELSFPALTSNSFGSYTNQFNNMLSGVTNCTVHFPSNLESVIGSWSDVTAGFGGTNTTVLFDLPATE